MWTGQDGTVRASYEITADNIQFLGGRDEGSFDAGDADFGESAAQEEDEIPF